MNKMSLYIASNNKNYLKNNSNNNSFTCGNNSSNSNSFSFNNSNKSSKTSNYILSSKINYTCNRWLTIFKRLVVLLLEELIPNKFHNCIKIWWCSNNNSNKISIPLLEINKLQFIQLILLQQVGVYFINLISLNNNKISNKSLNNNNNSLNKANSNNTSNLTCILTNSNSVDKDLS